MNGRAVAVIGLAGRFPGASDVDALWANLRGGVESIHHFSPEELARAGVPASVLADPAYVRAAPLLEGADRFAASFFGISRREAERTDPEHRIFLEACRTALEDAGHAGRSEGVGVFAGGGGAFDSYLLSRTHLNARLLAETASPEHIGNDKDYLATRVSHRLDLRGPSYTLQCACSTSLVAVHVACQSLLSGETDLALAGGVNVRVPLHAGYLWTEGGIRSRDGRCRPFDAEADGTIFGSGVGVVALRRLEDAQADGDPIRAVILGSAVCNDGAGKTSYWSSGAEGQARAMREALAVAGVDPATVGMVEAHGTATAVGDPVEVFALNRAYGRGAGPGSCALGSLKSNLGHLEAAAGVAGLIKAVLALQHGVIPATLHFRAPNPRVPFEHGPFYVNAEPVEWPRAGDAPRRAAVNSLGIGGTNAHVVLEEAPAPSPPRGPGRTVHVVPLSAKSPAALRVLGERYAVALEAGGTALADVAHTAAVGRVHLPHRRAVVASDLASAAAALRVPPPETGTPRGGRPRVAFLYSGQGSQYAGMGAELGGVASPFAETVEACDRILAARLGWSLRGAMAGGDEGPVPLDRTLVAQPALFVVEAALTRLLASWGIEPDVVLGHSVGEYAAAWAAGVFDLETALSLLALRAREMDAAPGEGGMAAVLAPEARVARIVADAAPEVEVAVRNGPENVVVSGARSALDRAVDALEAEGIRCRPLRASHAFHSPLMAEAAARVAAAAGSAALRAPERTFVSNLTGEVAGPGLLSAAYWGRQLREPVRFGDCLRTLAGLGVDVVVEVGPGKVLAHHAREALPGSVEVVHTLERGVAEWATALEPVRALYERGARLTWPEIAATDGGRRVSLPTYPYERERYWLEPGPVPEPGAASPAAHPLLGRAVPLAEVPGRRWQSTVAPERAAFIADHVVYGRPVMVGVGYLETALSAARALHGAGPATLTDVVVPAALAFAPGERRLLQTALDPDGSFRIHSAPEDASGWTLHAAGRVAVGADAAPPVSLDALRLRCAREIPRDAYYSALAVFYGPSLRNLSRLWRGEGEALGLAELPGGADPRFVLDPALLDACLQVVFALLYEDGETSRAWVPVGFERVEVHRPGAGRAWSHVVRRPIRGGERSRAFDVELIDPDGGTIARLAGVRLTRTSGGAGERLRAGAGTGWVHDVAWRRMEGAGTPGEALDRRAAALGLRALRALGWGPRPGERVEVDALSARLRVAPGREAILRALLRALEREGTLVADGEGWTAAMDPGAEEVDGPEPPGAEGALLARCGAGLPALLRGEASPLDLLFPGGALEPVAEFHRSPASFGWAYGALEGALRAVAAGASRGLRVLEVGAGTGGATEVVLRVLGRAVERYDVTDVSTRFLEGARARLVDTAAVSLRRLDLEEDPEGQGFEAGGYDLVVAANVAHATRSVGATLARLRRLLGADGTLLLLEGTAARPWLELTFGLTDGWRAHLGDPLRPDGPLLDPAGWRRALREAGFAHLRIDADPREHAPFAQAVIRARPAPFAAAEPPGGEWIVAGDEPELAAALARGLEALGERVRAWEGGADVAPLPAGARVVLARTAAGDPDPAASGVAEEALGWLHALAARGGDDARFFLVTRGARGAPEGCVRPDLAPLWGMARIAALEHPELGCRRVDLDPAGERAEGVLLAEELRFAAAGEDELARRGGAWWAPRLVPAPEGEGIAPVLSSDGAYVVTGGLGGVGLAVARRLVARGARRVHLLSRRAPGAAEAEAIRALRAEGAEVAAVACDVGDREVLRGALEAVRRESGPLRGVFHAAGVLSDGPLLLQDGARLARVFRPKVLGGWNLHLLTAGDPLDHFVLFSSAANLLGSAGQAGHAAACAFLDALAAYRAERGLAGVSLPWGPWLEVGAAVREGTVAAWEARGIRGMPVSGALDAMEEALARAVPLQGIFSVDWSRFDRRGDTFFSEVAGAGGAGTSAVGARGSGSPSAPAPSTAARPRGDWLEEMVRASLGLPVGEPMDPRAGLFDLGLDSLTAIQLRNRLQKEVGRPLPVTLVLDHPTLQGLRAYFAPEASSDPAAVPAPTDAPVVDDGAPSAADSPVEGGEATPGAELEDRLARVLERLRY